MSKFPMFVVLALVTGCVSKPIDPVQYQDESADLDRKACRYDVLKADGTETVMRNEMFWKVLGTDSTTIAPDSAVNVMDLQLWSFSPYCADQSVTGLTIGLGESLTAPDSIAYPDVWITEGGGYVLDHAKWVAVDGRIVTSFKGFRFDVPASHSTQVIELWADFSGLGNEYPITFTFDVEEAGIKVSDGRKTITMDNALELGPNNTVMP